MVYYRTVAGGVYGVSSVRTMAAPSLDYSTEPPRGKQTAQQQRLHAYREFAQEFQLVVEHDDESRAHVGTTLEKLFERIDQQSSSRLHPLIYANLAAIVALIFYCGVQYQRMNAIEDRLKVTAAAELVTAQMGALKDAEIQMVQELQRTNTRIDRLSEKIGK